MRVTPLLAILLPWWLSAAIVVAQPATEEQPEAQAVRHELSFPQRHNQYVHVQSIWPVTGEAVELSMPSWTPGSYLIRDFAAHVEGFAAMSANDDPLQAVKVAKNRWRVETAGAESLVVEYDVWAGELNVAASWVENDLALLNGAGIFLYSESSRDRPQRVRLVLPDDWGGAHTSLRSAADANTYIAENYDELVDSPIVAGTLSRHEFGVKGQSYALIQGSGGGWWDLEQTVDDLADIVEAHQEFWGVSPFDREYLFINLFTGSLSGLEHDHSTVMTSDAWQMLDRADYVKWLGVASHEFFHAWNVRRVRPQALKRYEYDREVYTRELWLAEGLSSYYDGLLLFRSGAIGVAEYFELLAQEIHAYESLPGRQVRSAEHASFDAWIKQYKPDGNTVNSTVSYYRKGALIGFVTDTAIRRETRNRASLDTVMREMYQRYGPDGYGQGVYPPGAFEQLVERITGPEVRARVENLLRTTDDPDVDGALDWYGLALDRAPGRAAAEETDEFPPAGFGVVWDATGPQLLADQVILGRAAARAGMLPGDELLAIDNVRVTPVDYLERIRRLHPGDRVILTLARHGRLMTLPVYVEEQIPERYVILTQDRIGREEKARLTAWLGRELRFIR